MSGFGKHDKEEHNQEINDASDYLVNSLIPAFARTLSEKYIERTKKNNEKVINSLEVKRNDLAFR